MPPYRNFVRLDLEREEAARVRRAMDEAFTTTREAKRALHASAKRLSGMRARGTVLWAKWGKEDFLRYPKFQFEPVFRPYFWRIIRYYMKCYGLRSVLNFICYAKPGEKSMMELILAGRGEEAVAKARIIWLWNRKNNKNFKKLKRPQFNL